MTGKYQAYPEYKDSGVEWIGMIPKQWDVKKAKHLFRLETGGTPSTSNDENFDENGIPWVKPDNLNEFIPVTFTQKHVSKSGIIGIPIIPKGSILVCGIGTVGKFGIAGADLITNQQINAFIPDPVFIDQKFAKYLIASSNEQLAVTANKVVVAISNKTSMQNIVLCVPLKNEQKQIANFLDHETAKIDTLIEKQQQLIKLLKEKRQAVISHAVTKGLNPNAPMRDSGVEWLGEVPEHWEVTRAKFISNIFIPQRNKPELNDDYGVAWATMEDMKGIYIEDTKHRIDDASAKIAGSKTLKAGAVIASCVGNFGVASINKIDVVINQQLQAFIPNGIKAEYLRETISISKNYFELIGTAATLVYVNQQGFENLPVLVPPADEQEKICGQVEAECYKFDKLISLCEEAIGLIKERRTALISAAVTGKIDVRNWQSSEPLHNTKEISKEEAA